MFFTIIKGGSLRSPPAPGCGRPQAAVLAGAPLYATNPDAEQKHRVRELGASVPTNG